MLAAEEPGTGLSSGTAAGAQRTGSSRGDAAGSPGAGAADGDVVGVGRVLRDFEAPWEQLRLIRAQVNGGAVAAAEAGRARSRRPSMAELSAALRGSSPKAVGAAQGTLLERAEQVRCVRTAGSAPRRVQHLTGAGGRQVADMADSVEVYLTAAAVLVRCSYSNRWRNSDPAHGCWCDGRTCSVRGAVLLVVRLPSRIGRR